MILWILRFVTVLLFLVLFLRRSTVAWAVGLLTVVLMVFLDALSFRNLLDETGYYGFFLGGLIVGGVAVWLTRLFSAQSTNQAQIQATTSLASAPLINENTAVDRKLIYDQIRNNLGANDVLDLIFDLGFNENELVNPNHNMPQIIVKVIETAERQGVMKQLAMAVERILTPVPKENLPRLEKLSADTPSNLLRQFIVANYTLSDLAAITTSLGVDWEEMGTDGKKNRVRRLLLYLRRRNQSDALVNTLQTMTNKS